MWCPQSCLHCDSHVERENELYCSPACYRAANPSSPTSLATAIQSTSPAPVASSSTDGWDANAILRWRSQVTPGAPPSRARSPSPTPSRARVASPVVRVPSPTASSSASSLTPGRTRPKLMQLASSPVSPSVSVSYSPFQHHDQPKAASPPRHISPSPRHLAVRHNNSRRSSMTCTTALTSDDSIATPVTPALAIPVEPVPTDMRKHSQWKRVRTLAGPTAPTPRVRVVESHFPAYGANRKHTPLYLDEESLGLDECKVEDSYSAQDSIDEQSTRGSGLAGWFIHRAEEQRREREARAVYAKRGRRLHRAEAAASYYAVR